MLNYGGLFLLSPLLKISFKQAVQIVVSGSHEFKYCRTAFLKISKMNTDNILPSMEQAIKPFVQMPKKRRLEELVNNPPQSVLIFDYRAVKWLDELKNEIQKL